MTAPINKPLSAEQLELFKAYYIKHGGWHNLSPVLTQSNTRDSDVESCQKWARDHDDLDGYVLCKILMDMSQSQRIKLARQPQ